MTRFRTGALTGALVGALLATGAALAQRSLVPVPEGYGGLPPGRVIGLVCTDYAGQPIQGKVPVGTATTSQALGATALSVRCP